MSSSVVQVPPATSPHFHEPTASHTASILSAPISPARTHVSSTFSYYDKGATAEFRTLLQPSAKIDDILSIEEVYKMQNALLEARDDQINLLPHSYLTELLRLSEIIQKKLAPEQHEKEESIFDC